MIWKTCTACNQRFQGYAMAPTTECPGCVFKGVWRNASVVVLPSGLACRVIFTDLR